MRFVDTDQDKTKTPAMQDPPHHHTIRPATATKGANKPKPFAPAPGAAFTVC